MNPTNIRLISSFIILISVFSCQTNKQEEASETEESTFNISEKAFGDTPDGPAMLYSLNNGTIKADITNYGALLVNLVMPDKHGHSGDIVLGFENIEGYLGEHPYFGGTIGRYGNRIAKASFSIEGQTYELAANNGPNHLHGGEKGFDRVLWEGSTFEDERGIGVKLTYTSPDGEEGYPGTLEVTTEYILNEQNELLMTYRATTDKPTVCNLTNHTYFNLAVEGDILSHQLTLMADHYTPVDETLIPTGEMASVEGTPFDFREGKLIGEMLEMEDEQLTIGGGIDHNMVFSKEEGMGLGAIIYEPESGRKVEIYTMEPGVQFYTGNFLDGTITGKAGKVYEFRNGLCLETQHFPDSPNQENFPSTLLKPGETYYTETKWRLSAE